MVRSEKAAARLSRCCVLSNLAMGTGRWACSWEITLLLSMQAKTLSVHTHTQCAHTHSWDAKRIMNTVHQLMI